MHSMHAAAVPGRFLPPRGCRTSRILLIQDQIDQIPTEPHCTSHTRMHACCISLATRLRRQPASRGSTVDVAYIIAAYAWHTYKPPQTAGLAVGPLATIGSRDRGFVKRPVQLAPAQLNQGQQGQHVLIVPRPWTETTCRGTHRLKVEPGLGGASSRGQRQCSVPMIHRRFTD